MNRRFCESTHKTTLPITEKRSSFPLFYVFAVCRITSPLSDIFDNQRTYRFRMTTRRPDGRDEFATSLNFLQSTANVKFRRDEIQWPLTSPTTVTWPENEVRIISTNELVFVELIGRINAIEWHRNRFGLNRVGTPH